MVIPHFVAATSAKSFRWWLPSQIAKLMGLIEDDGNHTNRITSHFYPFTWSLVTWLLLLLSIRLSTNQAIISWQSFTYPLHSFDKCLHMGEGSLEIRDWACGSSFRSIKKKVNHTFSLNCPKRKEAHITFMFFRNRLCSNSSSKYKSIQHYFLLFPLNQLLKAFFMGDSRGENARSV